MDEKKQQRERMEVEVNLMGSFDPLWTRLPEILDKAAEKTIGCPHVKINITCRQ